MTEQTFDYIVIGGGSAGCVLAARLSEEPSNQVLLLEAGHAGKGFIYDMPAGTFALMGNPKADWIYPSEADASANGRATTWSGGKMLGGSSGMNGMVYIRGQRGDFDAWRDAGCPGWGFDDLLPYFLKSERFFGEPSPVHGRDGPLAVSPARVLHPLARTFMAAAAERGIPTRSEYCAGDLAGAFLVYGTTRDGQRCSARRAYLDPAAQRKNLTIIDGVLVDRILIQDNRAMGVEVVKGQERLKFMARGEVLLSAGTISSPAILLRSGIGPGEAIHALGIAVNADLPGVGSNVQEHCGVTQSRRINIPSYNTMLGPMRMALHLLKYLMFKQGVLTSIAVHAMAYARSQPSLSEPDLAMSFLPMSIAFVGGHPSLAKEPGVTIGSQLVRPMGRGRIRLRDPSPESKPLIEHSLLSHPSDLELSIRGCSLVADIFSSKALLPYVVGDHEPATMPMTDSDWESYARQRAGIGYHPVGSCKMGGDTMAVVNPALQVHGVEGLRVVDASIMPNIISGNTNAATIALAEKGADLIRDKRSA